MGSDEMQWLETLCGKGDGCVVDLDQSRLCDRYGEEDVVQA